MKIKFLVFALFLRCFKLKAKRFLFRLCLFFLLYAATFPTSAFHFSQISLNKANKKEIVGFSCFSLLSRLLTETALLLPSELSKSRHENDTVDIRRNLRLRYRDTFKHNRAHE